MRPRHVALILALAVGPWLLHGTANANLRVATLTVKGMVCQA